MVLLAIGFSIGVFTSPKILLEKELYIEAGHINETVLGLETDHDSIYVFGNVPSNTLTDRRFNLTNNASYPIKIKTKVEGNILPYINISNPKIIEPMSFVLLNASIIFAEDAEYKRYNGTIKVTLYK